MIRGLSPQPFTSLKWTRFSTDPSRRAPYPDSLARRMADAQIYLAGSIDQTMVPRLIHEVSDRVGKGARSVLIALSSPGGNVYWGVTAYNFLRGLGVELITHNAGQVDSIAGVVFCAGDSRFAVTQSRFLIHGVSWTLQVQQAFSEKDLTTTTDALTRDRDTIAAIAFSADREARRQRSGRHVGGDGHDCRGRCEVRVRLRD